MKLTNNGCILVINSPKKDIPFVGITLKTSQIRVTGWYRALYLRETIVLNAKIIGCLVLIQMKQYNL